MNPNTVSLYIEAEQDTLVGNFIPFNDNDPDIYDEFGNIIPDHLTGGEILECNFDIEYVASSLCTNYALNQIRNYNKRPDSWVRFKIYDENDRDRESDGGPYVNITRTGWTTKIETTPLLKKYSNWHQGTPFNDFFPKRLHVSIFPPSVHYGKAPAGCFPLALAKILTYFQYPDRFEYNGRVVNWENLNRSEYGFLSDDTSAPSLLRGISHGCDSWYFYEGTFTFPHKVSSYMRSIGLSNAHNKGYDFDIVVNMIDNGKPIIISSVPGINITNSHSWNIDGYKIKERTVTYFKPGTRDIDYQELDSCKMVHCDFGWRGTCNGYYISGVFKLDDPNSEKDNKNDPKNKTNFNHIIRIITYDKPRP